MAPFMIILAALFLVAHTARAEATFPQIISCSLERPIDNNNIEEEELVVHTQSHNPSKGSVNIQNTNSNGNFVAGGMRALRRHPSSDMSLTWLPVDLHSDNLDNQRSQLEQPRTSSVVDGSLSNGGYAVSIGGDTLMTEDEKAGITYSLATGVDYHIRLSPTMSGLPVVAFLIRLEPGNANVNTTLALRPFPLKSQVVDSCVNDIGMGGLSHKIHYSPNGPVANDDPGEIGLVKMDMADTDVVLTVTVVDSEYNYYSSSYKLNFENLFPTSTTASPSKPPMGNLTFGSGRAPTMSPTSSPVREPDTSTLQPVNTPVDDDKVKTTTVPDDSTDATNHTMSTSSTDTTRVRIIVAATALGVVGFGMIAIFVVCSYKKKRTGDNDVAPVASGNIGHELV